MISAEDKPFAPDSPRLAGRSPRLSVALAMILAAALAVLAFGPALHNEFVYDDLPIISMNPLVTQPGPWYRFWCEPFWPRMASPDKLYRPLTVASYRANALLTGGQPKAWSFHVVNLGLHALTAAGVALLVYRLSRRPAAAWIAGALFAVHPLNTESVVTGYGRAELMAGCFGVWLLVRHVRPLGWDRPRSAGFQIVSALLFLAAIMSKEHAVFLWPCVLAIDCWPTPPSPLSARGGCSRRTWFRHVLLPSHVGFMLTAAGFFYLRHYVFGWNYMLAAERLRIFEYPLGHVGLIPHLLMPCRLLWLTVALLIWPPRLCPIWSYPALSAPDTVSADVLGGMIVCVAMLVVMAFCWARRKPAGAVLAGILLLLLIPLQAIPVAKWVFAERWLYLPSILIFAGFAALLGRVRIYGVVGALAAACVLLPASWSYSAAFADNLAMNQEVVRRQPDNFQGRKNVMMCRIASQDYAAAGQAATELLDQFGTVPEAYRVLLQARLGLRDGRGALEALRQYELARGDIPGLSLIKERQQAEQLIAREGTTQPAASGAAP